MMKPDFIPIVLVLAQPIYASVLVVNPQRRQGVVILTNGDNGAVLWREILNSVSIEYGWVENDALFHAIAAVAILLALPQILLGEVVVASRNILFVEVGGMGLSKGSRAFDSRLRPQYLTATP